MKGSDGTDISRQITDAVPSPPAVVSDRKAEMEARLLFGRMNRSEGLENCLYWVKAGFVVMVGLALAFVTTLWFLHLVLPEGWRWISETRLAQVQNILCSGMIGSLLTTAAKKLMGKDSE